MPTIRVLAATVAASLFACGAVGDPVNLTRASGPNAYFNRPGADMATHDRELAECAARAARAQQPAMASSNFLTEALLTTEYIIKTARAVSANVENCMVVRGWRVVELPLDEADEIAKFGQAQQAARLGDWVGAQTPHGVIVRQWTGDLGGEAAIKFKSASASPRLALSFTAKDWSNDPPPPKPNPKGAWNTDAPPAKALSPAEIADAPPDVAVVIFRIVGPSLHDGDSVVLQRILDKPDGRPDALRAYDNEVWERSGKWFAFEAPPGRYRVESIGLDRSLFELNFCLGSPAFDARAGEVVYAGIFNLGAADIGPDLDLAAAKLWLGPQSAAASRLRPASYVNGSQSDCGGTYISALEVKGAPFEPGYDWGSLAARRNGSQ